MKAGPSASPPTAILAPPPQEHADGHRWLQPPRRPRHRREAIVAATRNPLRSSAFPDRGFHRALARADLLLFNTADERTLAYEFGTNLVERVWTARKLHDAGAGARPLPGRLKRFSMGRESAQTAPDRP